MTTPTVPRQRSKRHRLLMHVGYSPTCSSSFSFICIPYTHIEHSSACSLVVLQPKCPRYTLLVTVTATTHKLTSLSVTNRALAPTSRTPPSQTVCHLLQPGDVDLVSVLGSPAGRGYNSDPTIPVTLIRSTHYSLSP